MMSGKERLCLSRVAGRRSEEQRLMMERLSTGRMSTEEWMRQDSGRLKQWRRWMEAEGGRGHKRNL
jgi:hypothetical protein